MGASFDILIANARALRLDRAGGWLLPCDIAIRGGRLVSLAPAGSLSRQDAATFIDARGGVAMPGLVNAHTHSPENIARGRAETARLPAWLNEIWPSLDQLGLDRLAFAIELGAAEMIRHGVTGVVDHFRQTPMSDIALSAAIEIYGRIGLRTTIAVMLRDAAGPGGLVGAAHVKAAPHAAEQVGLVAEKAAVAKAHGVALALGPSAPHRCSDRLLDAIARNSGAFAVHTHVDETRDEADAARKRFGRSAIAQLKAVGLLGPRTACAHVVHSSAEDIALLAETGTTVVHNPLANLRLGSGIAPLADFLLAGVPVALGTDGAASNDTQNPWEVIKTAALLARVATPDERHWPGSETVLDLATRQGHRVTGLAFDEPLAGSLAEGAPADLIVFDDDPLLQIDADRPAASLMLGSPGRRPRHVVARGRLLLHDDRLTTIDEERLRQTLASHNRELAA